MRTRIHVLGWRRASIVAGDGNPRLGRGGRLHCRVLLARGQRGHHDLSRPFTGTPDVVARALAARPDGVATFLIPLDDQVPILRSLAARLDDPHRLLLWSQSLLDPALLRTLGARLDGVVSTTWLPSSPHRRSSCATSGSAGMPPSPASPRVLGDPVVIGYHNSMEAILTALERVHSADVTSGLESELKRVPPRSAGWAGQSRPEPAGGSRRLPLEDRRARRQG